MGFVDAVKSFYRKYVDFSSRASRSECWWVALYQFVISAVLMVPLMGSLMAAITSGDVSSDPVSVYMSMLSISALPFIAFYLVNFIPSISLAVRRIHDFNKSGWLYLIVVIGSLIPIVSFVVSIGFLVVNCLRGTVGPNRFGEDPLQPIGDTFS